MLQPSSWDRLVRAMEHPVRAVAWLVALGVLVGPVGGPSWIAVAGVASVVGLVLGETMGSGRLRSPVALGTFLLIWMLAGVFRYVAVEYAMVAVVVGPVVTHWLGLLLTVGATTVVGLATLRLLSRRGPAFAVVELCALSALLAGGVAGHRDGAIARPLWLSDLCWSFGVDPGQVLLAGGALLTALLACLLLLSSDRRKPTTGLLILPLLTVIALLLASRLPALEPPDPKEMLGMGAMGSEGGTGGGGGAAGKEGDTQSSGEGGDGDGNGKSNAAPDPLKGGSSGGENRPVAVVLLDDDHEPMSGYWFLRQDVLPAYNGSRMVPSTVPGTHADVLDHHAVQPEQVELDPIQFRKTIRGSVSLLVEHPTPFAPSSALAFAPRGNPYPARFKRSYAFASRVLDRPYADLITLNVGDPMWSPELRAHYLEAPDDPRYRELADTIEADLRERLSNQLIPGDPIPPFLLAVATVKWIGDNMKYSKRERHADVPDPTADFLFGNRIGYCVHTAHASVYLWRLLGIPARIATGYAVEEQFRRGGTLVVMGGDAHAWPELYVEGVGWVPLDVSPAEDLDKGQAPPPDEDALLALGDLARDAPDLPGPRPDYRWVGELLGKTATGALGLLVLCVLVLHWLVKAWRRSRPLWAPGKALSRVGYRAALDVLTDAGHVRRRGESREAFARRLRSDVPALTSVTDLHLRGALGQPDDTDPERDRTQWNGRLAHLRHELSQTVPVWRRLLGFLDPSTPYRSR